MQCLDLLIDAGADVSSQDNARHSPPLSLTRHLWWRCTADGRPSLLPLVQYGVSPLHLSAANGRRDCAALLLDAGAPANSPCQVRRAAAPAPPDPSEARKQAARERCTS